MNWIWNWTVFISGIYSQSRRWCLYWEQCPSCRCLSRCRWSASPSHGNRIPVCILKGSWDYNLLCQNLSSLPTTTGRSSGMPMGHRSHPVEMKGFPDSKVHGANMGPIWGRQGPGGPHVGPMNFAIWGLYWHIYTVLCRYSTVNFHPKSSQMTPHSSSVRARYGMSFVSSNSN